jgi:predicted O-linked N-acetylglucosamine transferase (SPINDLY family)
MPLPTDPSEPQLARLHRANALLAGAQASEAAAEFAAVLDARPDWLVARHGLVRSLLAGGDFANALLAAMDARLLDARNQFAAVLADFSAAGAPRQHADLLRAYLHRHPHDVDAALALAAAAHALGHPGEALHWSAQVLAARPQADSAREIRAASLIDRGDVDDGLAIYRDLLRTGNAETAARHLVLMHYDPAQTNAALFAAHRDFAQHHLVAHDAGLAPRARKSGALRIGWLSPRLAGGPVATFLGGLLAHFDRTHHRHVLVDLEPTGDASARHLYALADEVVDAGGLDDAALLQKLRDLDLDVAIDLAGHSSGNRLAVLARRVAPLQVSWLDWFDTTAVPAMDAWISDAWLTPVESTQRYTERVVRLDAGRFCYTPIDGFPVATGAGSGTPSPAREGDDGVVVFGSFNRLAKFNDAVIDAWAEILRRIPGAQLELRARLLGDPETCAHYVARFARRGIDAVRLRLRGELPYRDLLAAYRQVDIALDPFPFSGCTTTCDALWMGCATITLPGETFVSRQSASLLWRLGRSEWVAQDARDYVDRAVALAADVAALRTGRGELRERVERWLCDSAQQAIEFADMLDQLIDDRASA